MSERHPLASPGAWVELRDVGELRAGDQMDVMGAMDDLEAAGRMYGQMTNALAAVMVVNWQLPSPLPLPSQDVKALRLMEIDDYNRLVGLLTPAMTRIFPGETEPASVQEAAAAQVDPASPTVPTVES
jgi:hypothetical protein